MNKLVRTLDALSDETRLRIFLLLMNGNLCVCELVNILDMKQARISRIMKIMNESGLTINKRAGKWIVYSVNPEALKLGVVRGLIDDINISVADLEKLKQCKKESIRESCCKL